MAAAAMAGAAERVRAAIRGVPRWAWITSGVVGVWSTLRAIDRARLKRVQAVLFADANQVAEEPLSLDAMPRRVLVVYDSKAKGHVYFREFVKPVLDAGALDYKTFDTAPGAAYDVAHELQNAQGNVDGIVAISTSLFREIVNGMADRIAEKGDSAAIPIAFVPMPHLYGLAKLVGFFADASTMKLMGFPALTIVHGATRPINERDIDHAEQFADKRVDRRRALSEPEKLFTVKRMALDGIQIMIPKADAQ